MGKQIYFLTESTSNKIKISWQSFIFNAFKRNIVIQLDGQVLDSTVQQIELEKGKTYSLSDGSSLAISLNPNEFEVRHNDQLVDPYLDIAASLKETVSFIIIFGLFYIGLGLVDFVLTTVGKGTDSIYELGAILIGVVLLVLGYLFHRVKSPLILWGVLSIVIIQSLFFDVYIPIAINKTSVHFTNFGLEIILVGYFFVSIKKLRKASVSRALAG
jgi:hypothetical protein